MAAIKAGDRVRIVTREATGEDLKTGLYFSYLGGLTGTVDRTYDDDTVCVDIDLESLTDDMRERHLAMQEAERKRWISNLSDEARNRLSAAQKQLKMSYRLLVSKKDVETYKGDRPRGEAKPETSESKSGSDTKEGSESPSPSGPPEAAAPKPAPPVQHPGQASTEPQPRRATEADLEAAEEAFLRSRQQNQP